MMELKTYDAGGIRIDKEGSVYLNNKFVGEVRGSTYFTWRKPQHYMVKHHGFGISLTLLMALKSIGVYTVIIQYDGKTGKKFYKSTVDAFINSELEEEIEGFDKQKFMSENDMEFRGEFNG